MTATNPRNPGKTENDQTKETKQAFNNPGIKASQINRSKE